MKITLLCITLVFLNACTYGRSSADTPAVITMYNKQEIVKCGGVHRVVLVGGCFDLLHYGHLEYLRASKQFGDYLIIALEPDEHIRKYKHRQPVHNQQQRAINLSAVRYVDQIVMLPMLSGYEDYFQLVQNTCPNIIAVTEGDPQLSNIQRQAKEVGAKVRIVVQHLNGLSSTSILKHGDKN